MSLFGKIFLKDLLLSLLVILFTSGCVSISRTSTGDFYADERIERSITEIVAESRKAANKIKSESRQSAIRTDVTDFANRHFVKANEIVLDHVLKFKQSLPFVSFNDFVDKRKILLKYTTSIEPSLVIFPANYAAAIAFPHGEIFVSIPLITSFNLSITGYDDALLGIFIHEMIHVRDGHSIEQWSTADGRKEVIKGKVFGAMADMTILIPVLYVDNDMT